MRSPLGLWSASVKRDRAVPAYPWRKTDARVTAYFPHSGRFSPYHDDRPLDGLLDDDAQRGTLVFAAALLIHAGLFFALSQNFIVPDLIPDEIEPIPVQIVTLEPPAPEAEPEPTPIPETIQPAIQPQPLRHVQNPRRHRLSRNLFQNPFRKLCRPRPLRSQNLSPSLYRSSRRHRRSSAPPWKSRSQRLCLSLS